MILKFFLNLSWICQECFFNVNVSLTLSVLENKLGLSCAKLRASLNLSCFDKNLDNYDRLVLFKFANLAYGFNYCTPMFITLKVIYWLV